MNIIENCDIDITFLVNDKRGTEIITENMFEHLLHFATQAAIQIFFQTCYQYCFTLLLVGNRVMQDTFEVSINLIM